ncbi:MAG: ATP-dependent helicase [Lachnospiraceae bacterium]|nr:ATP-dependent helicase [Lachnospiraceae bacterium]
MALQFILGPSGAGKSRYIFDEIIGESLKHPDRQYLLLVPEQYTMETQRELILLHPRHGLTNIDVLSFNRLAYRVFEDLAVEILTVLDDMGKSMILRKVAGEKKRELHYYQRHLGQVGFVNQLKSLISEMYQYGVTPEMLKELMGIARQPILKEKLSDFGLLYESFQEYIQDRFTTAEEVLDICCRELPRWEKLSSSWIYLDSYTGFTPVQYRILEIFLRRCSQVKVAVTVDLEEAVYAEAAKFALFYMSRHMICQLIDLASGVGVRHTEDVCLSGSLPVRFKESPRLAYLEKHLGRFAGKRRGQPPKEERTGGEEEILIYPGKNPAQEVRFICHQIQRWLRRGLRYRDMAVITGDLPSYGREIRRQFEEMGIPYFLDDKKSILTNPLVELIRSALEAVRLDFPYESVFRCLKTGLVLDEERILEIREREKKAEDENEEQRKENGNQEAEEDGFTVPESLDRLENYVKALGIRGFKRWSSPWERRYRGAEKIKLEELNWLRQAVEEAFGAFRASLKGKETTGSTMTAALREFLEGLNLEEKLEIRAERLMEEGKSELSGEYSQVYALTMEMLERLEALLGDEPMGLKEYAEILDAGFGEIEVGTIPATLDRVIVGDITRSRLHQIQVLYFVGVNEGVVLQRRESRGLLTDEEREFFSEQKVELAPTAKENGLMQRFYLYLMLTKPARQLVVTYGSMSGSGKELRPSSLIEDLTQLFPDVVFAREDGIQVPWNKEEAFDQLAQGLRRLAAGSGEEGNIQEEETAGQVMELFSYLYHLPEYAKQARQLAQAFSYTYEEKGIGRAAARALYGPVLQGSVTRLEQYASCAYAHFLRYGLELMERREYELGMVDMGNLFHESLDLCFEELQKQGLQLAGLSEEKRRELVTACVTSVAEDYGNTILHSSSRNAYLIRRLSRITDRTMWALGEQLKKGEFKPVGFEVSFSAADNLEAMKIALSEDEALHLQGRIDRLDLCEDETHVYVKIIDYKSGSTSFDLAALYYGLQLQLVVYMDAAMELQERRCPDKEVVPAGLFYYNIQDPMVEKTEVMTPAEIEAQIKKQLKMNGLVNSDLEVIQRMDREIEGESDVIPVAVKSGMIQEARSSVASGKRFGFLREYVRGRCKKVGQEILQGGIGLLPYKQGTRTGCDYCPYHAVCGFDKKTSGFGYRKLRAIKPEEIWKEILPEEELPEDELEDDDTQKAEETGMRQGKSEDKNKGQNKQALHVEVSREVQDGSKVD